ncbi:MAG: hypothetical protein LZ173_09425, partial [Thaumarchaeota archaeon]|nr:hypothetical protein [Candidatus Geocrenenecus arthurdayi]
MRSKKTILWISIGVMIIASVLSLTYLSSTHFSKKTHEIVRLAVEFNIHAAPVYIARHFDWFSEEGLNTTMFNSY